MVEWFGDCIWFRVGVVTFVCEGFVNMVNLEILGEFEDLTLFASLGRLLYVSLLSVGCNLALLMEEIDPGVWRGPAADTLVVVIMLETKDTMEEQTLATVVNLVAFYEFQTQLMVQ